MWSGKVTLEWQQKRIWRDQEDGEVGCITLTEGPDEYGPQDGGGKKEAPDNSVTCVISFLAKPALKLLR